MLTKSSGLEYTSSVRLTYGIILLQTFQLFWISLVGEAMVARFIATRSVYTNTTNQFQISMRHHANIFCFSFKVLKLQVLLHIYFIEFFFHTGWSFCCLISQLSNLPTGSCIYNLDYIMHHFTDLVADRVKMPDNYTGHMDHITPIARTRWAIIIFGKFFIYGNAFILRFLLASYRISRLCTNSFFFFRIKDDLKISNLCIKLF